MLNYFRGLNILIEHHRVTLDRNFQVFIVQTFSLILIWSLERIGVGQAGGQARSRVGQCRGRADEGLQCNLFLRL